MKTEEDNNTADEWIKQTAKSMNQQEHKAANLAFEPQ